MKNGTLQKKWTVSSAISIFLSFLALCIILYFSIYNWMLISEKKIAQNTLNEVVVFLETRGPIVTIQDISRNRPLLTQIVNQKQSIRIVNKDGIEVLRINDASKFPSFTEQVPDDFRRTQIDGQKVMYKTKEVNFGAFAGYVEISHSLDNFSQLMNYILIAMAIFALISLFLSALIGYVLASVLLKPLKELRDEMQRAKQHKFSKEVTFEYTAHDEIGELLTIYKQLMYEVGETIKRQDEFIHNISHELRTPVQVVEGHLSLLNRWGKEDKAVLDESLHISLEEIRKMKLLMEEMLKLARREQSQDTNETNILDTVIQVKQAYKTLAPNARVKHTIEPTLTAKIPPTALQQILRNLIDNSIKYNEHDPIIDITATKDQENIRLKISDNGIGIPENQLSRIFDRFYTVDASRTKSKGGSGLGLSIVNMLVKEYKGRIVVKSELGKGTSFSIYLPIFYLK